METKIYPMLRDVILAVQKHLPTNYFGEFTFKLKFKNGQIYSVTDVWGERTLDVEKLK